MKILFVCQGNIFRSAVAEAFANDLPGAPVQAESAGTHARVGHGPHEKAVLLLREQYGLDLSQHQPRQVDDLPLETFDRIVAIDALAAAELLARFPACADRLAAWDIPDPGADKEISPQQIVELIRAQVLALATQK